MRWLHGAISDPQLHVKTTLEVHLGPVEEMPWAKPGRGQETLQVTEVRTVMGCCDGGVPIMITTF